uniref:DUF8039 domain-containing protein n=1 Tax=Chenopodium quinoa TaxID=63459 RepID=A0A803MTC6_CHEQI
MTDPANKKRYAVIKPRSRHEINDAYDDDIELEEDFSTNVIQVDDFIDDHGEDSLTYVRDDHSEGMLMARNKKQVHQPEGNEDEDNSDVERLSREYERGRTVLAAVGKAIQNGTKIPLEWDPITKLPCGEHRLTFSGYIGVIVRERNALKGQAERGEIVFENRRDDILARALKKAERGGHVRGVGSGITKKQYFGFAKPTPRSQLHNELNCVRSEVAMLKNQNNVIMSYLLSGQNIEEFKQLMASGVSSQSSVPTGQGNGSGQPNSTCAQQENATQVTSGQSAIFSQGNLYTRPQEFQETEYTRPHHNEEQEHELEPYQVSWPDTTNANSPQHGNCSVPWPDTYDTQPISNLPEGMHDCCLATEDDKEIQIVAIGQVYISGSTLVVKNHFFDLAPGTHRVSVIDDLVPKALLPCPTELFTFVCQAKDSFVPWPTHLIFSKKK